MKPDDCIFFLLSKASQAAIRFWGQQIAHLGVRPIQGLVLMALRMEDRIPSRELGTRVDLDSATITGVLDRLEGLGLVRRTPNPDDRRSVLVELTEKGKETSEAVVRIVPEANRAFLQGFSQEERMMLRGLLRRARDPGPTD